MKKKLTKAQQKALNTIADKVSFGFMVNHEDKNEPVAFVGANFITLTGTGDGVNDAPVIDVIALSAFDIAELLEAPAEGLTSLLSKYFIEK